MCNHFGYSGIHFVDQAGLELSASQVLGLSHHWPSKEKSMPGGKEETDRHETERQTLNMNPAEVPYRYWVLLQILVEFCDHSMELYIYSNIGIFV